MRDGVGKKALRAALIALVFAAFQECALRVVFPLPEVLNFDRVNYSSLASLRATEGGETAPILSLAHGAFVYVSEPDGVESVHRLNLYGFRDSDWSLRTASGPARVLLVGDSMVEGFLVARNETMSARFEEAARRDGADLEALNLGIGGTGIPEYLRLLRAAVPLLRPDHVILVLYANDFGPVGYDPGWLAEPEPPVFSNPWLPRLLHVLRASLGGAPVPRRWHSEPFRFGAPVPDPKNPWSNPRLAREFEAFVDPGIAEAMRHGEFNPFLVNEWSYYERSLRKPRNLRPHLRPLKDFLRRESVRLWVAYLPSRSQVSDRYVEYQRRFSEVRPGVSLMDERYQIHAGTLERTCRRLGLPFLDLTPALRGAEAAGTALFWRYDGHLNGDGNRLVGEALHAWWSSASRSSARAAAGAPSAAMLPIWVPGGTSDTSGFLMLTPLSRRAV